jgi:NAD(P)-dependent dehydrogenase (short-subunit alcohol dehydrogenase family)
MEMTDCYLLYRGIGLESSILFAQEGANVLLVDINLPAAEKGAAIIAERYPNVKAIAIKADVGRESDVKSAVDQAVKIFGRLDIMVYRSSTLQLHFLMIFILQFNNAGLFILIKRLHS